MRLEIQEQPQVIENCHKSFRTLKLDLKKPKKILILGCGTAHHAGKIAQPWMPCTAHAKLASELTDIEPGYDLVILVSQSGETSDVTKLLPKLKHLPKIAIVNVSDSTIAKSSDYVIPVCAGKEKSIPATKSLMGQLCTLFCLSEYLKGNEVHDLQKVIDSVSEGVKKENEIIRCAQKYHGFSKIIFLGTKQMLALAKEADLKMKETSYMNSYVYPSREFLHGPIAIVDEKTLVVALLDENEDSKDTLHIVQKAGSHGAKTLAINCRNIDVQGCDNCLYTHSIFESLVCLQLFAYHMGRLNNCPIDEPRYLKKAVVG